MFIGYGPVCESGKQLRSQGEVKGISSGVAKLGHTGARTLATRGCAPPLLKIIGAECTVINRANWALKVHKGVEIELRRYCYLYLQNNEVSYAPLISIAPFTRTIDSTVLARLHVLTRNN